MKKTKPTLDFWQIWNMSFGFLGIQMGFALQNGNASRILQSFGADVHELPWFWIVAPLMGMIVQPIVGYYSDRTWTSLGRRRPFFLAGAIMSAIGLILMPNAPAFAHVMAPLWIGAGMLMIMDASFNVAMEPFRALVADKLPSDQRTLGYSLQTVLIGIGAVIGSWLPYVLAEWFDVGKNAAAGTIPQNVIYSFFIGAAVLVISILWTILKTPEYTPEEMAAFDGEKEADTESGFSQIFSDIKTMPKTMRQLGWVQFFSWFALFAMWVFTTPAVAQHTYGLAIDDTHSSAYQDAGNWVGIIFGVYNAISAIYAFFLPAVAKRFGRKNTHAMSLVAGGIGLISMYFFRDPYLLLISMVGVGIAWASILAMPYAILAGSIPLKKMGIYMGIFNLFITIPQIVASLTNPLIVKNVFNNYAIYALVMAGVFMFLAAFCVRFVDDVDADMAT